MASGPLLDHQCQEYERDDLVLVRGMFDDEEIGLLRRAAKEDREIDQHCDVAFSSLNRVT